MKLNALGGAYGIGRVDLVEGRLVGMKSHGVYETPGGTILYAAHRELESLVLDRQTIQFKDMVALKYAELVYDGMWFSPLRESLEAFVDATQGPVTGEVKLKLYKGSYSGGPQKQIQLIPGRFCHIWPRGCLRSIRCPGFHPFVWTSVKSQGNEWFTRLWNKNG